MHVLSFAFLESETCSRDEFASCLRSDIVHKTQLIYVIRMSVVHSYNDTCGFLDMYSVFLLRGGRDLET